MLHKRYLNFNAEVIALALRSGILSVIFSLIFTLYAHQNLNFILAVIGVFIASLIETVALQSSTKDQVIHGMILSIGAAITLMLGSMVAHHPLLLSLGMLIFMLPVGLSARSKPLTATTILFIANQFIIGSGLPAPMHEAIIYGMYLFIGGTALVVSGYLQNLIFKNKYDFTRHQNDHKSKIFSLNASNLKFALKLSIAVCAANAIAGYFKISTTILCTNDCPINLTH